MCSESRKTTVLICALAIEAEPVLNNFTSIDRKSHKGIHIYRCEHKSTPIIVVVGGVGMEAANKAALLTVGEFNPSKIVNFGFAGAVEPTLKIGQVVVVDSVGLYGKDSTPLKLATINSNLLNSPNISVGGKCLQVDRPFNSADKKLAAKDGAVIVDMESWSIANVALENGISSLVVRAITDEIDCQLGQFMDKKNGFDWKDRVAKDQFLKHALPAARNNAGVIRMMIDHWATTEAMPDVGREV
ncbi:MAG TPA: hypothetical protein QF720_03035 [Nitrospinota bacterium]|nr:hypothetical protein [Nitrospinota bacterium]|tara:strand:- start:187325 stop:188056 length:732 start_codon:yes stop_codon:yes gene_type:complete